MIINYRGPYKAATLDGQIDQIRIIGVKMGTYKLTLDLLQPNIDRVNNTYLMLKYVDGCENSVDGYKKNLNDYKHELLSGDKAHQMNAFPVMEAFATAPAATKGGIWHFIESQRSIMMEHDNWTDGIGEDMHLLGPMRQLDSNLYVPEVRLKVRAGVIEAITDSAIITNHKLYVGPQGIDPIPFITDFKGAKYEYHRTIAPPTTSEKLNVMIRGMFDNEIIGHDSAIVQIAYKG